ncbi:hypothetical protein GTP41_02560 [Pseudoduganella sp. DS3]|uniref:DUF2846 domain-containing protein n=1 Tax=Pseudoduganella guangdongensis TaxID=2692179 RepID=A0A6N9HBP1_9BURK|nr:hypothetical protein [Pseudoduganella guangdongensis]MYN00971.1 hypothetical protein [Pseudoduganella guangdongensis]
MNETELIIQRSAALWQDRARKYQVLLDGKFVADIGHGQEVRIALQPGRHSVQMKIDWCTSPALQFDCAAGQAAAFMCGPNAKPFTALLYITLWKGQYLWLRPAQPGARSIAAA